MEWTGLCTAWSGLPRWARWVLAAYLAGFVRRAGIWLAAVVITLDMTANWIGNWPWLHADPARLARAGGGLLLITFFGLFVLLTARPMLRVMRN